MEGNEEALTFVADAMSEASGSGSRDDNMSENGDDQPTARKLATFSLSMSTMSDYDYDDRCSVSSVDDGDYTKDIIDIAAAESTPFSRRELRLSRILGISADERVANRLMHGDSFSDLQPETVFGHAQPRVSCTTTAKEDTSEFDYLDSATIRRCISLKSSKTPPGTPHRKKAVRFADVLGLDLATTKQILNQDEPPSVPESAMRGLQLTNSLDPYFSVSIKFPEVTPPPPRIRHLCACFAQPGFATDFLRRVEERKVSLEHCTIDDVSLSVSGTIRVANVAFEKQVTVRYTTNGWMTFTDEPAAYVPASHDDTTDQFSFVVRLPSYFDFSSRMEFSILYVASGEMYWDSNFGANYRIECHEEEDRGAAVRRVAATHELRSSDHKSGLQPFY